MSEQFKRDNFVAYLNTTFQIFFTPDVSTEVTLIEVSELRERPGNESFSIIFLAPSNSAHEQQIYKIEHIEMGSLELFLVPVGADEKGVRYESVFNFLIQS